MPIFFDRIWFGHEVLLRPHDKYRKFTRAIFHYDILPYLYGSCIWLDLIIKPRKELKHSETLQYEWFVQSVDGNQVFEPKKGYARLVPNKKSVIQIATDLIHIPSQYKLEMRIGKEELDDERYEIVADLTVKDRDDFYLHFVWLIVDAVIGFVFTIIGGAIVLSLRAVL